MRFWLEQAEAAMASLAWGP